MFLLDLLCNLPRLQFSEAQMRAILFVMSEAGCQNVPSLDTLHRFQDSLNKKISAPLIKSVSSQENVYYTIDLASQIAQDFSNPQVRPFLQFYPEDKHGEVGESWQALKWLTECNNSVIAPMAIGMTGQHFYVGEVALCNNNQYVIPLRWVICQEIVTCDAIRVLRVSTVFFVK